MNMMTKSNISKVAFTGFLGCMMGLTYGGAHIAFTNYAVPTKNLIPNTDALHNDKILLDYFLKLQEYKYLNDIAFLNAVSSCDRLIFLHNQLKNKIIQPILNDRIIGFTYYKQTIDNIDIIYKLTAKEDAKIEIKMIEIKKDIIFKIREYWESILNMTYNIN